MAAARGAPDAFALPAPRLRAAAPKFAARGAVDAAGWPNWLSKAKTHRGVRALRSADASSLAALGAALVQERVRPLLLPSLRRAFDIGLYVVVSSVRPLRVYAHDVALVRFCEAEYPTQRRIIPRLMKRFVVNCKDHLGAARDL